MRSRKELYCLVKMSDKYKRKCTSCGKLCSCKAKSGTCMDCQKKKRGSRVTIWRRRMKEKAGDE